MATESAAACLPAGVLLAESLKVPMLVQGVGLSVPGAVSAIAARKYLLLTSQSIYILLAVALGWSALDRASTSLLGASYLPTALAISGVVVALAGAGMRVLLSQGGVATRLRALLARSPIPAIRRAVAVHAERFHETDHRLQRFFALSSSSEAAITACFIAGWLFEALETFVILRLLGVELDFFAVLSFEVGLSLVRSLVFIVPAGLGVQDAGYVLFLRALGVPDAATLGAAFSLIKRAKEIAWAAFGFGLLALPQILPSREKHAGALAIRAASAAGTQKPVSRSVRVHRAGDRSADRARSADRGA
jgi:hypothetical protein